MKCYENLVKADINIYADNVCCLVLEEEDIENIYHILRLRKIIQIICNLENK